MHNKLKKFRKSKKYKKSGKNKSRRKRYNKTKKQKFASRYYRKFIYKGGVSKEMWAEMLEEKKILDEWWDEFNQKSDTEHQQETKELYTRQYSMALNNESDNILDQKLQLIMDNYDDLYDNITRAVESEVDSRHAAPPPPPLPPARGRRRGMRAMPTIPEGGGSSSGGGGEDERRYPPPRQRHVRRSPSRSKRTAQRSRAFRPP